MRNKKRQYTRRSVFKFAQFAPGACSQIFNRLNIVEHFAGWKFCGLKYTHEIVGAHRETLLPERAPGACSRMKTPRVCRPLFHLAAGHKTGFV